MKWTTLLLFCLACTASFSQTTDEELASYIKRFRMKPMKAPQGYSETKFRLGEKLFFDTIISGNKNVSCATCHDPNLGTGDALPLPLGVGANGIGTQRVANGAPIIPRNAPPLYNLHDKAFMFWDGRVSYDGFEFQTPEPALNGENPAAPKIVAALDDALSAQALFPPLSHEEMRGHGNEIANASTNLEAWKRIMNRLMATESYPKLFKAAYPNVNDFNIGHMASAIGHFQAHEFAVTNTPWDEYLKGDKKALSESEKRGAIVFFTTGRCVNCHSGDSLGGSNFRNIAAPQIGPGKDAQKNDEGLFLVTGRQADLYKFKTPGLRNVAKTAPYLHAGTYNNLMDVINHYARGTRALDEYSDYWLKQFEINNYQTRLFVERNSYMLFRKKENAHPLMRGHRIRLTNPEKNDLLIFMEKSLTEK